MEQRSRRRNLSPGGRMVAGGGPLRSSTGQINTNTDFGQYYPSYRPAGLESYQSPRDSGERVAYDDRRATQDPYLVESPATIKPRGPFYPAGSSRRNTLEPGAQRPTNVASTTTARPRSIIHNGYDNPPLSPAKGQTYSDEESYYIQPASSRPPRNQSKRYTVDAYNPRGLAPSDRDYARGGYRGSSRGYYAPSGREEREYRGPGPRYDVPRLDKDDGYAYTEPHDLWQEPPPRRRRESSVDRSRPYSMAELGQYLPREPRSTREAGPPPSTRGFGRGIARSGSVGHDSRPNLRDDQRLYRGAADDSPFDEPHSRAPVSVHQKPLPYPTEADVFPTEPRIDQRPRDRGGLDDNRRAYDDQRYEGRRSRETSQDRYGGRPMPVRPRDGADSNARPTRQPDSHRDKGRDDSPNRPRERAEEEERRRLRDRDRDRDFNDRERDETRRRRERDEGERRGGGEVRLDEDRRRPGRDEDDANSVESDREKDRRRRRAETLEVPGAAAEHLRQSSRDRTRDRGSDTHSNASNDSRDKHRPTDDKPRSDPIIPTVRDDRPSEERGRDDKPRSDDKDTASSTAVDEDISSRKSVVRVVSPSPAAEPEEPKPLKGILRKPKDKFPEPVADVREGVAPLKETLAKKGIPANAKWTKISRKMVNPEALQEAQERFEERLDHVIVLRVMPKEEIDQLAKRTQEIRDARYNSSRRDRERGGERGGDRHRRRDDEYDEPDDSRRYADERDRDRDRHHDRERGDRERDHERERGTRHMSIQDEPHRHRERERDRDRRSREEADLPDHGVRRHESHREREREREREGGNW